MKFPCEAIVLKFKEAPQYEGCRVTVKGESKPGWYYVDIPGYWVPNLEPAPWVAPAAALDFSLEEKKKNNVWDNLDAFLKVHELRKMGKWSWSSNMQCKYVDLRIDMRDGGCIIMDRDGKRIDPKELEWQYGKEGD